MALLPWTPGVPPLCPEGGLTRQPGNLTVCVEQEEGNSEACAHGMQKETGSRKETGRTLPQLLITCPGAGVRAQPPPNGLTSTPPHHHHGAPRGEAETLPK